MVHIVTLYVYSLEVSYFFIVKSSCTAMATVVFHVGRIVVCCVTRWSRTYSLCFHHQLWPTVSYSLIPLPLELYLTHLLSVFIFLVIFCIVHFDVVASYVICCFEVATDFSYHRFLKVFCFVTTENIYVSFFKHAGCSVEAAFMQLCSQWQPSILVNIISFHCSLASLEFFKLDKCLVSSTTNCVDIPIWSLGVCKIGPAHLHEFSFFEDRSPWNILIILIRARSTNHKKSKSLICYYWFVSTRLHRWWNLHLMGLPWILSPCMIMPDIRIKKCA